MNPNANHSVITQLDCVIHPMGPSAAWMAQSSCAMTGVREVTQ